jgi:8-oxo-dGTP diphosphatase
MGIIKVVCGIIFKDDKIFLCRRNAKKSLAGYWEFPGGKIELAEVAMDALSRELYEELGMKVKIIKHFKTVVHQYDTFAIELMAYICQFQEANYTLTDHDMYEWVNKRDLNKWNLAPADIPIANAIINGEIDAHK